MHRGNVLKGQGLLHEAVHAYTGAIALGGGTDALAYNNLGGSLQARGSTYYGYYYGYSYGYYGYYSYLAYGRQITCTPAPASAASAPLPLARRSAPRSLPSRLTPPPSRLTPRTAPRATT